MIGNHVEGDIPLVESQVVYVAAQRRQRQFREIHTGQFTESHRRAVFKFHLGETLLAGSDREPFLDRSVHRRVGPFLRPRPAHRNRALDET